MNILYLSTVQPKCNLRKMMELRINYVVAPQKFHSNLLDGFVSNGHKVSVITIPPKGIDYTLHVKEKGIDYYFCEPTSIGITSVFFVAKEVLRIINTIMNNGDCFDAILCDSLNVSLCIGALRARRKLGIPVTAIVTDIMGISSHEKHSLKERVASLISNIYLTSFDNYVFLTEQMNERINKKQRPYIVMEGVCPSMDYNYKKSVSAPKRLFYAGGRPSKDGVDMLVSAFKQIKGDYQLDIYGNVPGVTIGKDIEDERIVYHGIVDNSEIVKEEYSSTLLVNPRPTNEEYTKYSFPSKLMEYMNTGTPLVTTKLPGIPIEYYDYIYTFDTASVECYRETLKRLLSMDINELNAKGEKAREFVKKEKNSKIQTSRIVLLINKKN